MYLKVKATNAVTKDELLNHSVKGFDDYRRVGAAVARAVTDWLRSMPVGKQARSLNLHVVAEWQDTTRKEGAD